jgi:hypothetical protein
VLIAHRYVKGQNVYVLVNTSSNAFESVQFTISREDNQNGNFQLKDVMSSQSFNISSASSFFGLNLNMQPYQTRILIFDNPTGLQNQFGSTRNLNIYPNPASDKVRIDWFGLSEQVSIELISMDGKALIKENADNNFYELNLPKTAGVYFIKVSDFLGNSVYKKLVIQ